MPCSYTICGLRCILCTTIVYNICGRTLSCLLLIETSTWLQLYLPPNKRLYSFPSFFLCENAVCNKPSCCRSNVTVSIFSPPPPSLTHTHSREGVTVASGPFEICSILTIGEPGLPPDDPFWALRVHSYSQICICRSRCSHLSGFELTFFFPPCNSMGYFLAVEIVWFMN